MSFADEFKKFIMRGNVVDLAVGVVIGAAFGRIVSSLVDNIFMPFIGLITGGFDISGIRIGYGDAHLQVGLFLQAIINFVIIGFCLFLVVKAMNRLMKREEDKPPPEQTHTEKLLGEIRDLLARTTPPAPAVPESTTQVP